MDLAQILIEIISETWGFTLEAAPYLLFGFFAAGVIHGFVSSEVVARHLGAGRISSVVKAALWGVPLPLCSCGVLPAALGLRKKGAGKGATLSFLVSTPETGVDSIAFTYALMDPLMTIFRPLSALVTAILAGITETFFGMEQANGKDKDGKEGVDGCTEHMVDERDSVPKKIADGLGFAFGELLRDIIPWLTLGLVLAGTITALIPDGFIEANLGGGLPTMLLMLVVGIPLYICASASTPIAAALMLKGLSPGGALVFLLAGPATNIASLTTLAARLGIPTTLRYLASICAGTLLMGLGLEYLYPLCNIDPMAAASVEEHMLPGWVETGSAILLMALSARSYLPHVHGSHPEACTGSS